VRGSSSKKKKAEKEANAKCGLKKAKSKCPTLHRKIMPLNGTALFIAGILEIG
jgi:hypothetical protein